MHVVMYHPALRMNRRVHLPYERTQVHSAGLGGLDGFNIGKMFTRMFTFKPSSFTFKNIMGAIGSGVTNFMTLGAASAFAPKQFSAHNKQMQQVGMGVSAAAAVAAGVTAGAAFGPAVLSAAKTAGGAIVSGAKTVAGGVTSMFGGGSSSGQSSGWTDPTGGQASTGGSGWLDTAGKVLDTGAKVLAVTQPQPPMGMGIYDSSGVMYAPQPIVMGQYPQVTGVAPNAPTGWYPTVDNQALMYAGQAGVGVMPGGAGMNGGYYDPSGGPVQDGVIVHPDGTIESSTIISGVADKYVYIGGGALVLGLLYALS